MHICIVGDELVAGTGDNRALGWVGRVVARSVFTEVPVVMPLARPTEDTAALSARWEGEVTPRLAGSESQGLVIAIGAADVPAGTSLARTRLNLANIVDRATTLRIPVMVVGPPPLGGVDRSHLAAISKACQEVTQRRHLPFVDTFTPLVSHPQWEEDMAASQNRTESGITLPGQAGYALMAWLVLHQGWHGWTGSSARA